MLWRKDFFLFPGDVIRSVLRGNRGEVEGQKGRAEGSMAMMIGESEDHPPCCDRRRTVPSSEALNC